ncbi:efflux RND transporter periplasmic adaptor subunit, partial [Escherichia coli]|nr:efflux RND transporter periplasmic adaptor subunit [Escherichia coli]
QLATEEQNTRSILEIEQRRLDLAESDLTRARDLVAQGTTSQSRLDEQERATLQLRRTVRELTNTLGLIPVRQAALEARLARANAAQQTAQHDLSKPAITAPFDLRVGPVGVE